MASIKPHQKRPIRFQELWLPDGWHVKIYTITEPGLTVQPEYIEIAKSLATRCLKQKASADEHHHCAVLTLHIASMFNQIVLNWWARENELRHHVFKAEPETPTNFRTITHTGEAFCIWELGVIGFERNAWMEHVLLNGRSDIEGYLNTIIEGVF